VRPPTIALALLLANCGDAQVTEPVTVDLVRLFRVSDEGPPTTRIVLRPPPERPRRPGFVGD
jgi:hypothetical protein